MQATGTFKPTHLCTHNPALNVTHAISQSHAEIREIKEKLDQADARRKALEDEKVQKLEEHLQRVKNVRDADPEKAQYEQHKAELDQKMKAVEQRRVDLENALKEKIQARQALADQVRQRMLFPWSLPSLVALLCCSDPLFFAYH